MPVNMEKVADGESTGFCGSRGRDVSGVVISQTVSVFQGSFMADQLNYQDSGNSDYR